MALPIAFLSVDAGPILSLSPEVKMVFQGQVSLRRLNHADSRKSMGPDPRLQTH